MKTSIWTWALVALLPLTAQAEGDWKKGRVYYRMVCTACHEKTAATISPNQKTQAEWKAYLQADKHAKGRDKVSTYVSKAYRGSIKATNKAAAKFAEEPEATLMEGIKAFLHRGAKDGDAPARCS